MSNIALACLFGGTAVMMMIHRSFMPYQIGTRGF